MLVQWRSVCTGLRHDKVAVVRMACNWLNSFLSLHFTFHVNRSVDESFALHSFLGRKRLLSRCRLTTQTW